MGGSLTCGTKCGTAGGTGLAGATHGSGGTGDREHRRRPAPPGDTRPPSPAPPAPPACSPASGLLLSRSLSPILEVQKRGDRTFQFGTPFSGRGRL